MLKTYIVNTFCFKGLKLRFCIIHSPLFIKIKTARFICIKKKDAASEKFILLRCFPIQVLFNYFVLLLYDFNIPMNYKNDTIIIREFAPQELPLFSALFENEKVTRYLPYKTPDEYEEMFDKALSDYKTGPFSRWGVFSAQNNDLAGMCLVRVFLDNPDQLEIGYTLGEEYWGRGLGTEVCKALIEYCLSLHQQKDIVAVTDPENTGSQKVLMKNGFRRVENLVREGRELAYFVWQK